MFYLLTAVTLIVVTFFMVKIAAAVYSVLLPR